jgi:DNA repair exonuclease SbcCD ATPase subunit
MKNLWQKLDKIRGSTKIISQAIAEYIVSSVSEQAELYLKQAIDYVEPVELTWMPDYDVKVRLENSILNYSQLSGGQKTLVALAIRLAIFNAVSDHRLLILDEPTANLDPKSKDLLIDMLHVAQVANQMIIVTHDTSIVRIVSNVIYV